MTLCRKEQSKINANTFELAMETMLELNKWREALQLMSAMDSIGYKPSIGVCVELVEQLEKAREYKAVLAVYHFLEFRGYDFYENALMDKVFKRLVKVAAIGIGMGNTMNMHEKHSPLDAYLQSKAFKNNTKTVKPETKSGLAAVGVVQ